MTVHNHPHRFTFTTATLNVKSNPEMSQAQVVHDVEKASHQADLIGWNEISPDRYFQAIKQLGPSWGHYMPHDGGLRIPNPISWKKSVWKKEDAGFIKTHNGKAKVSPNRYITWVKLKSRQTGKEVVRINTHFVSGAFSHGQRPTTAWRQKMWGIHQQKLEKLVDHFKKKGLDVVVGGDFNRDSYHVLGNHVQYDNKLNVGTHGHSTYDYLMHAGDDLHTRNAHVVHGFASDHDAVVATYSLSGGKKGGAAQDTTSHTHGSGHTHHGSGQSTSTSTSGTSTPTQTDTSDGLVKAFENFLQAILQAFGL